MKRALLPLLFVCAGLSAQTLTFRDMRGEPACPRVDGESEKFLSVDQVRRPSAITDPTVKLAADMTYPKGERKDVLGLGYQDAKGTMHSLSELKGKVTIIGLWSRACDPSMKQLGELAELQKKGAQFGFNVLPLHFDDWPAVVRHLSRFDPFKNLDVYKVGVGDKGLNNLGETVTALPAVYLVDAEGRLAYSWVGYYPGRMVERLKVLLMEAKPAPAPVK